MPVGSSPPTKKHTLHITYVDTPPITLHVPSASTFKQLRTTLHAPVQSELIQRFPIVFNERHPPQLDFAFVPGSPTDTTCIDRVSPGGSIAVLASLKPQSALSIYGGLVRAVEENVRLSAQVEQLKKQLESKSVRRRGRSRHVHHSNRLSDDSDSDSKDDESETEDSGNKPSGRTPSSTVLMKEDLSLDSQQPSLHTLHRDQESAYASIMSRLGVMIGQNECLKQKQEQAQHESGQQVNLLRQLQQTLETVIRSLDILRRQNEALRTECGAGADRLSQVIQMVNEFQLGVAQIQAVVAQGKEMTADRLQVLQGHLRGVQEKQHLSYETLKEVRHSLLESRRHPNGRRTLSEEQQEGDEACRSRGHSALRSPQAHAALYALEEPASVLTSPRSSRHVREDRSHFRSDDRVEREEREERQLRKERKDSRVEREERLLRKERDERQLRKEREERQLRENRHSRDERLLRDSKDERKDSKDFHHRHGSPERRWNGKDSYDPFIVERSTF